MSSLTLESAPSPASLKLELVALLEERKRRLAGILDLSFKRIPGHFGPPWFLPFAGGFYKFKDMVK